MDNSIGFLNTYTLDRDRAVFTWLSKGIGFGFGFGFTTPFGWLVYLLWFWFYDSQVKTALALSNVSITGARPLTFKLCFHQFLVVEVEI